MPKEKSDAGIRSVHLLNFPEAQPVFRQNKYASGGLGNVDAELKEVIDLVPQAAKSLEELRSQGVIGSSFDAQINILTKTQERYTFLKSFINELGEIFKVSQVQVSLDAANPADLSVRAEKAQGAKCVRCWNYSQEVGKHPEHPLICDNCLKALGGK
jgi:isoleucyl-tRNA synthetase